MKVVQKATTEL